MKYRLRAALAAIALVLLPGALFAGAASGMVVAGKFAVNTHTVTGMTRNSEVRPLRNSAATVHGYANIACPPGPDGQARALVIEWNLAVFQNKPTSTFDRLLDRAAQVGITLQVERSD